MPRYRHLGRPHLRLQAQQKAQKHPKVSALVNMLKLTHTRNPKDKQLKLQKSEAQINHKAPKNHFKPWLHCCQAPLLPLCSAWCQTLPSLLLSVGEDTVRGLSACL